MTNWTLNWTRLWKLEKEDVTIAIDLNAKFFLSGEDFQKKAKCKHGHCSPLSNGALCDMNSKDKIWKLRDNFPNSNENCQKQITFSPKKYLFEGASFKVNHKKFL